MVSTGIDFGRIFARVDPERRSEAVSKYNERRFYQAALFYGCTVVTYIASKIAYRGVVRRRYVPNFYQHNHVPPKFSFYRDALSAVTHASLLAVSSMSMFVTGSLWYCDISSASEFSYKMKKFLGGAEAEAKLSEVPVDQETLDVQNALGDIINGSYDDDKSNEEKK
ncbi:unnamed protein product [[Candida] boidinii]|uniref:Unnamed protein product n=1 Tax=Candida boidinii TaxID=5477 RepID=A0ACB5TQX2_CANBO|nr:unnamed protein product [[Candida] boidinii]GME93065.1 unnamed protein product [[Candida] boidinii]